MHVCIVVAEDMPKEEMERNILENHHVPKNCRIVCRTVDITDPASIDKCSVDTCRTVIVSPVGDMKVIKAVLAVSALLEKKDIHGIRVNAMLSREKYSIPVSIGYVDSHQNSNYFNDIDEAVTLSSEGSLIVITKENAFNRG